MTTSKTPQLTPADFTIPGLLILLSTVPILGGIARFMNLSADTVTTETARFVHSPAPVVLHVLSATVFCVLGAFLFPAAFRRRWPKLHRPVGRLLAVCGLIAAGTGLWMTVFYEIPAGHQGPLLYAVRVVVAIGMLAAILIAWRSVMRRDLPRHEAFSIRAYALGQGAGTQVLVLLPWVLISGESEGLIRDLLMTLSWAMNIVVAEVIIARRKRSTPRAAAVVEPQPLPVPDGGSPRQSVVPPFSICTWG